MVLYSFFSLFSYFTDLQGSQTYVCLCIFSISLVTLLIYKFLKPTAGVVLRSRSLVTLLIYKVLKPAIVRVPLFACLVT